ncbi:helix-turn-helix transcriptional regulator [Kribbella sp. NBC_00382]|uniref:helix-turn-helix transcriptional regulator n=1 Tax=Kribbella sp. NBC_00382 TaxID=2975967 RepID=UPI002E1E0106
MAEPAAARSSPSPPTPESSYPQPNDLTGESPLGYLTDLRMTLAADLLAEPGASVGAVARRIGYADAFSFSAAFKRERGISPSNLSQPATV